jgi:LEA14-like dessication related protein
MTIVNNRMHKCTQDWEFAYTDRNSKVEYAPSRASPCEPRWSVNENTHPMKVAAFALALVALSACANLGARLAAPKVTVEAIAIGGIRGNDAAVTLSLRVENPNTLDLTLQSLRFGLSINDIALTSGTTVQGETIAAGSSALIDIETHTNINAALKLIALSANRRTPSLQYAIEGEAIVQNGIRLPFARRGDIPLRAAPAPEGSR